MQPQQQQQLPGSKEPLVSQKDQRWRQQEASKAEVVQLALDMTRQTQKPISAHQQLPHETSPAQPIQHLQQLPQILFETPNAMPTMQPQQQPGPKVQAISKQDPRSLQPERQKAEIVQLALDTTRQMEKPVSAHQQLAKEASTAQQIHHLQQRPDMQSEMPFALSTMQPQQQPGPKVQAISKQDPRSLQPERQKAEIVQLALDTTRQMEKPVSAHQQLAKEASTAQQIHHLQQRPDMQSEMPFALSTMQPQQQPGPKVQAISKQDPRSLQPERQKAEIVQLALDTTRQMEKPVSAHQQLAKEASTAQQIHHLQQRPDMQSEMPFALSTMQPQQQPGPKVQAISKQDPRSLQPERQKAEIVQLALDTTRQMEKPVSAHQQLAKEASTAQQIQQQKGQKSRSSPRKISVGGNRKQARQKWCS
ncbi:hypothetical protein Tcan_07396 [Toxocara canis]|uniref:Uncharacterized protein n=1 Tax=Toxocara canis TaxID=6265 RepID=A0A0B2W537_TOXCA|nr:hypothetical protein Tcan_07396 [Toxocara canis]